MIMTSLGFTYSDNFDDITNHWANEEIEKCFERQIITGFPDGSFRPDDKITRAEFITLVNRAFALTETSEINFVDVKQTDWYYSEIGKAIKKGFVLGCQDGTIRPEQFITREEVAVMLFRVLDMQISNDLDSISLFTDAEDIANWSKTQVNEIVKLGFMIGCYNGEFKPQSLITRAESAVILNRILESFEPIILDEESLYTLGIVDVNIEITNENIILKDTIIIGDLIISEKVGKGTIELENVIVEGTIYVKGGKIIASGVFNNIIISSPNVRFILNNGTIEYLEISEQGENSIVKLSSDTEVVLLVIKAKANIRGEGRIKKAIIESRGVRIEQKPDEVVLADGITAIIGYGMRQINDYNYDNDDDNEDDNDDDDNNDDDIIDYEKIFQEVKDNLVLTVQEAIGKNNTPKIILSSTDILGYETAITWEANNDEYITINEGEAIIKRRGNNDEDCGDCNGDSTIQLAARLNSSSVSINHIGDDGSCGDDGGGKKTTVSLIATITKNNELDTKKFIVLIPWGWGREITVREYIDDVDDKNDHDHIVEPPVPKDFSPLILWKNQASLILSAEELASNGETVTATVYGETEAIDLITLEYGRLQITPISVGETTIIASVYNDAGEAEVEFDILVNEPEAVTDDEAVSEAKDSLTLKLFNNKKCSYSQVNIISLPSTDALGYKTEILWEATDNQFVEICNGEAIIYRRGKNNKEECCDDSEREENEMLYLVDDLVTILSCDDGEGCGDDHTQGGKSNTVKLAAIIKRGEVEEVKIFDIIIPWGWGREITIYES